MQDSNFIDYVKIFFRSGKVAKAVPTSIVLKVCQMADQMVVMAEKAATSD